MSISERLANLSIPTVVITIIVLLGLRWVLLRQSHRFAKSVADTAKEIAWAMGLVYLIIRPFLIQAFFIPSESMMPGLRIDDRLLVNKLVYRFREPSLGDVVVFRAPPEAAPDMVRAVEEEANERGLEGEERERYTARECKRGEKDFIKRVIAVPGDLVRITPGYVTVGETQYSHRDLAGILSGYARLDRAPYVRLLNGKVFVDGRLVADSEIAAAAGEPKAKVKVVAGQVHINGRAIREPYIAEDPDLSYPMPRTDARWIVTNGGDRFVRIPKGKLLVMGDNRNNSFDARFWGLLDQKRVLGKAMVRFWPVTRVGLVR